MKFLIVDDHALIRDALQAVLLGLRSDALVLQAPDAATALRTLETQPDVDLLLLDVHLPDQDGFQVLASVTQLHPAVGVVMLSGERDEATMRRALDCGAQGFVSKMETREVLASALALVLAGGIYVPPAALRGLPEKRRESSMPCLETPTPESLGLTGRQMDVLALLMEGKNNKLICRALNLAEPTVKNHVSAILKALNVNSRTEAVLAVTRLGWVLPSGR
jgi:DNA-binding NarL/FixJ family response regulator